MTDVPEYDWGNDVYHAPSKFGLTLVATIDDDNANYSFDIIAVWKHTESGKLYWAQDSGCSCPSPFEDYQSIDKLTPLDPRHGLSELQSFMDGQRYTTRSLEHRNDFLRKVAEAA